MGLGFELEIALFGVVAVIILERALDIDRMGIESFSTLQNIH